ncbi:MAG: hypothetical protein LBK42_04060 [Propionibacteriaceae bacterium]|jgi:hypothetical protein|nr:hypothetical protein [Propionibacteriaceae bacterium]
MRIQYEDWAPTKASRLIVEQANQICVDYARQGYDLTLRQLYYQFVARGLLANTQRNYKNLGAIIDKARKAGLMDWSHIVDRTRNLMGRPTYNDPGAFVRAMAKRFHTDVWRDQPNRVEVWVEKEALAGVVGRAASSRGVDYFCCRGYVSQSELHSAAKRLERYAFEGQSPVVIHLGDHDPSGIDMTRDIADRLAFFGADVEVRRIALNADQIEAYNPPPNPAKLTDSRAGSYIERFGDESWELDALDPKTLVDLITAEIDSCLDPSLYWRAMSAEAVAQEQLNELADRWPEVADFLTRAAGAES